MSKLLFAAALGLAILPAGAHAQNYRPDIRIAYADLDLSSPAGTAELNHRIARAVSAICTQRPHTDAFWDSDVARCRRDLTVHVEPQRLQALASARTASPVVASTR